MRWEVGEGERGRGECGGAGEEGGGVRRRGACEGRVEEGGGGRRGGSKGAVAGRGGGGSGRRHCADSSWPLARRSTIVQAPLPIGCHTRPSCGRRAPPGTSNATIP